MRRVLRQMSVRRPFNPSWCRSGQTRLTSAREGARDQRTILTKRSTWAEIDPKQSSAGFVQRAGFPARRLAKPKQFKVPLQGLGGRKADRLHADGSGADG